MTHPPHIPLEFKRLSPQDMISQAQELHNRLKTRRSVRFFSPEPIPLDAVRHAIFAAAQSPSGAHKQPWTFALITDPQIKHSIRLAAEAEEEEFYAHRAPQQWLDDLAPFDTSSHKPFLEDAPALIVLFAQTQAPDGGKHYYVKESVGIAAGMLIASLHLSGLATLTHTPSPMNFLSQILHRPPHERPFLLLPVGYPAPDCTVPDLERKPADQILVEF